MKVPYGALAVFALFAAVLAGSGAFLDAGDAPVAWGAAAFDAAFLFASLALFFLVLRGRLSIPVQIFTAMVLGVFAGWGLKTLGKEALVVDYLAIFGELFILLLKMVIVPLVFVSVLLGVASLGDVRKLGTLGAKTLAYYFSTTAIAVLIGLTLVNIVQPGTGRTELREQLERRQAAAEGEEAELSTGMRIQQRVLPQFLQNPVMATAPILAIIAFAILLGAALTANPEKSGPAIAVFQGIDAAMVTLVLWIMVLAPLGVFALMARAVALMGVDYLRDLAVYCVTVVVGLALHFSFLTLIMLPFVARLSPKRFLWGMAPAIQLAFSTSSSSATLPVSIECAAYRVGINRGVVGFLLPIGATVNMDGTALYTAVASVFVAEVYGLDLGFTGQFMVFLTAIVVSVGAAGIPGASLGLMTIIFTSAGIPVEGIGLILGVDRVLDMLRTIVNVTGDSVGAAVVSRLEGAPMEKLETGV